MTNDEIIRYQKRAIACASAHGFPELADDFSSYMFIVFLETPDRSATVDQLFIDFLRKERGDTRWTTGRLTANERNSYQSLDDMDDFGKPLHEKLAAPELESTAHSNYLEGFGYLFKGQKAFIYKNYFQNEFTLHQVGMLCGLSESTICMAVKEIKATIKRHVTLKEGMERMEWDLSFLCFNIQWVEL